MLGGRSSSTVSGWSPIHTSLGSKTESQFCLKLCCLFNKTGLAVAFKYSPHGGDIQFKLCCQNDTAIFHVQDQGIGIPIKDQAHLFETFYRCGNVGKIQGTGLGLAIVKQCVELHEGQIQLRS
ncbi:MAG: sensor histidine kinase [Verrucomicrobia bacterium]|nr:sensor histidine kinase [Leptolyngbya sp. ES-bin-22]